MKVTVCCSIVPLVTLPSVGSEVTVGTLSSQVVACVAPYPRLETIDAGDAVRGVYEVPPESSHSVELTGIIEPAGVPLWDVQSLPLAMTDSDVVPLLTSESDWIVDVVPGDRLP